MSTIFASKKEKILAQLSVPATDYADASPKGSVDLPIQSLVGEINAVENLVTTSSCSGRVAIYVEGHKSARPVEDSQDEVTSPVSRQVKGGGSWLFVSHNPIDDKITHDKDRCYLSSILASALNESHTAPDSTPDISVQLDDPIPTGASLVHFKFEPLILHVLCASLSSARKLLIAAQAAGFRESGIASVPDQDAGGQDQSRSGSHQRQDLVTDAAAGATEVANTETGAVGTRVYPKRQRKPQKQAQSGPVMVAVRTTGLTMDAPIGFITESGAISLSVSDTYLISLVAMTRDRFRSNDERKERFRCGVVKGFAPITA